MESVTIVMPLPPACLSPNRPCGSRGGRMRRAAAAKRYRRLAREAVEGLGAVPCEPWMYATVQAKFYHETHRRRDDVNHLAMLKPAYDGLVDAGLLFDDDSTHLTTLPATFAVDADCPRVTLTVTRKGGAPTGERTA